MKNTENLAQAVEDVKIEVIKNVFKKTEGANSEDLSDVTRRRSEEICKNHARDVYQG
ncbi:MAG: hypothetical protein KIIPBIDF_01627 [Candidatus Methanoperedenaceae archaeon GB50]|nr:MAG: hypothetical protein KIIPBIDF_01627 [Candidatus Methanoperedenaceae archaeon GB50]